MNVILQILLTPLVSIIPAIIYGPISSNSAYESIINTRSFHRTRIEHTNCRRQLLNLTLMFTAEQNTMTVRDSYEGNLDNFKIPLLQ